MPKNVLTTPVSCTGSYTEDEPNFPWQKNRILQEKVSCLDKVVNFKDFSRPSQDCTNHENTSVNTSALALAFEFHPCKSKRRRRKHKRNVKILGNYA